MPININIGDRHFFCAWTPEGLKKIEGEFIKRIMGGDNKNLEKDILESPLTVKAKDNLLLNLRNIKKDG